MKNTFGNTTEELVVRRVLTELANEPDVIKSLKRIDPEQTKIGRTVDFVADRFCFELKRIVPQGLIECQNALDRIGYELSLDFKSDHASVILFYTDWLQLHSLLRSAHSRELLKSALRSRLRHLIKFDNRTYSTKLSIPFESQELIFKVSIIPGTADFDKSVISFSFGGFFDPGHIFIDVPRLVSKGYLQLIDFNVVPRQKVLILWAYPSDVFLPADFCNDMLSKLCKRWAESRNLKPPDGCLNVQIFFVYCTFDMDSVFVRNLCVV